MASDKIRVVPTVWLPTGKGKNMWFPTQVKTNLGSKCQSETTRAKRCWSRAETQRIVQPHRMRTIVQETKQIWANDFLRQEKSMFRLPYGENERFRQQDCVVAKRETGARGRMWTFKTKIGNDQTRTIWIWGRLNQWWLFFVCVNLSPAASIHTFASCVGVVSNHHAVLNFIQQHS